MASSRRKRAERVGIGRVFRRFEADLHVALRREIVNFDRLRLLDEPDQVSGVGHVAIMQIELGAPAHVGRRRDGRRAAC